jgi:transposase
MFGHDARLMPAKYGRRYPNGQKNDFRDAEAIREAVQRPTMKFVAIKTADQLEPCRSVSVPASSIRSMHSCWSRASPCGNARIPCSQWRRGGGPRLKK